jgi:hypothetical protein
MRHTAAVSLATLLASSILGAVCELTCVRHQHHGTNAAAEQSCHDERFAKRRPVLSDSTAAFCHEPAITVASTSAHARVLDAAPMTVHVPSALAAPRPHVRVLPASTSLGPPGIIVHTAPLRI